MPGCSANSNTGEGIVVGSRRLVKDNKAANNRTAGIQATGTACRIEGTHCTAGQRGFHLTGSDNVIVRNSTKGASVLAYDIAAGNHNAGIITSPGAAFARSSPWANFNF